MKKITTEKIDKYYNKTCLGVSALGIFMIILIFKNIYLHLYNIRLENFTTKEQLIANLTYIIFGIIITILFIFKHKNDTLDELKKYLKIAGIGLATILVYCATTILELTVLYYTKVDVSNMSITAKTIYLISCETLIMSIIAIINHKKIEENLKDIKKNYNEYFKTHLKTYILALIIMLISNLLINLLTHGIAGNEESIRGILNKAPVYMFFSAVFFAPFTEEMVFRLSIKRIITNKKAFIIASGLIFGGLHVIGNINSIYDILYIIPYATPGIAFAYMLDKTDNIFVPMGIHFLHNGLLMTLQAILLFL